MAKQSSHDKPLRLVCRCGYRKALPERFAGKKVVCPKCSSVLRIERLAKKTADLLVRCPWCDDVSDLNLEKPACGFCKRELEFDVFVGPLGAQPAAKPAQSKPNPPAAIPVAVPQDKEDADEINIETSGPAVGGDLYNYLDKRPSSFGALFSKLVVLGLLGAVGYLLWDKYGDELGLKKAEVAQGYEVIETPGSETPLVSGEKVPPRLTSPSIELLEIERDIAQALDPVTSEVHGTKLFLEINFRNLSPCEITKIEAQVQLMNGAVGKRAMKEVFEFERPVIPQESRTAVTMLSVQSITGAKVTVTKVWAGEQFSSTEIEREVEFN